MASIRVDMAAAARIAAADRFTAADFQAETGVSRETLAHLEAWRALLEARNADTNLVGRSTLGDFWRRHALDGWQVLRLAPDEPRWLEIGAGAGIPGIPVALGLKAAGIEGARVTLVESIAKKARFLEEAAAATGAPAEVFAVRAEALDKKRRYDVITARAVAPLKKLIGYAKPFVDNGAIALFPKGARYADELTEARKSWTFECEVIPSLTAPEAAVLKIEGIARVR